ncbi:MAG: cell division protein FtsL [Gammaproteobacteria bacterium]
MKRDSLVFAALLAVVLGSALVVVYAKHESRKLFVELQALQKDQDNMDVEWDRLQLEQSAWATHSRIEKIARAKLHMHTPSPDEIEIIRP